MSKQYNKAEKRQRRLAYIKRKKARVNTAKGKKTGAAVPAEAPKAQAPA